MQTNDWRESLLHLSEAYLLQMHALELGAGFNFNRVYRDIRRQRIPIDDLLLLRLREAAQDEVIHAQIIQRMLYRIRWPSHETRDLHARAKDLEREFLLPWENHKESLPLISALFNHHLEEYVVEVGLTAFTRNMNLVAVRLNDTRLAQLCSYFHARVSKDEPEHVSVGEELIPLLETYYPPVNMFSRSIFTGPLASFFKTRRKLERLLEEIK
jgi:hypothetical protein